MSFKALTRRLLARFLHGSRPQHAHRMLRQPTIFPRIEPFEERVLFSAQPDLTALSLTASPAAIVGDNGTIAATWTVKNQGTWAPTQNWADAFYLSNNTTYDSSAVPVGSQTRADPFPLAIGGSYTATTTLTVPNTSLRGTQYLLVVTDPTNAINESDTTNNTASTPVTLSAPNVNLTLSNVQVTPASALAGDGASVNVSWTVTNQGTDTALAAWADAVYLSTKTTFDASAQLLGNYNAPTPLAAGASYNQITSITVPNTALLGNDYLLVIANAANSQSEINHSATVGANLGYASLNVSAPGNVNLTLTGATAPAAATVGATINVSWTVQNTGAGTAAADWHDTVYASPTATYNPTTAQPLGSFDRPNTLAGSASYTQNQAISLSSAAQGNSYLLFMTNADQGQAETNSNDNCYPLAIVLNQPSLAITSFTAPATANLGDTIAVSWTVANPSTVPTAAGWSDALYVSDHLTFDSTAQYLTSFQAPLAGALAAGASYTQTQNLSLPYTPTGNRYLLLVADYQGTQPVTGTALMAASSAIMLREPDLAVALNSAPATAVLGQPFNLRWTVRNQGIVAANAAWEDAVFVSRSTTFDPVSAILLTTVNAPQSLAAGAGYTTATTIKLPSLPAGNYCLFVVADRNNDQGKSGESIDNVAQQALAVTGPDLTVQITSASGTVVAGNNAALTVGWTVTNRATADATATWNDTVYLSRSSSLNLNDPTSYWLLGSFVKPLRGPLNGGASYRESKQVVVPNGPAAGGYYLLVATNPGCSGQAETDITNNIAAQPITVTMPSVTLVVTSASANPATVPSAGSVTLSWTVQNQGTDPANNSWTDSIYLSSHNTLDGAATPVAMYFFNGALHPLAPNTTYTASATITVPGSISGTEYLLIVPDRGHQQAETSTNNVFALPITVSVPDVKLKAVITNAPSSAMVGVGILVSWTVTNQGTAATNASHWTDSVYLSSLPTFDSSARIFDAFNIGTPPLPLAPNTSYTQTQTVYLPSDVSPGSYFLLLKTDDGSSQGQTDASLNVASSAITLTAGSGGPSGGNVDLVITTATAPAAAVLGASIPISFTVQNLGTSATGNSWTDAVYLSNSPTLNRYSTLVTTFSNSSALNGGATYTQTQTITLPSGASAGNRYLLFVTNQGNSQQEIDFTNNSYALPVNLSTPDLAVTAASAPTAGVEGNSLSVSWAVQNHGTVAAQGPWTDAVYLSDTPTYDPSSALPLATFTEPGQSALAPQSSYTVTQTITLPLWTTGNRYLLFVTDSGANVADPDRTDNVQAVPLTLTAPDLAIANVSVTPTTVEGGNRAAVNLSWQVTDASTVDATHSWTDKVYLSTAPTFDPTKAIQIASTTRPAALAAGASYTTNLSNVVIGNLQPGSYYVFFVANVDYALAGIGGFVSQPETDTTDNILAAASPLVVTVPGVDLVVMSASLASTTLVSGQAVNASFQVKNQGSEAASTSWLDSVYYSTQPTFDTTARLLKSLSGRSPLAANASYTQSTSLTIPGNLAPGTYYLYFQTNANNMQGETNFANDLSTPLQVTVNAPDLAIVVQNAPASAKLNDSVSVTWRVTNLSTQYPAYATWSDEVFLSTKPTYDNSATLLTSVLVSHSPTTPLAAQGSYTQTQNIVVPNTTTGAEYLLFITNFNHGQAETNLANDLVAVPITVSTPSVNLQVVPGSVTAPATAGLGASINVSWSVKNAGSDAAKGSWQDYVYLSGRNTFDASAQAVGFFSPPAGSIPLAGNASYNQSTAVYVPSNLTTGTYYLYIVANASQTQSETDAGGDSDDVSAAVPINILAPNLQVGSVTVMPTTATYGATVFVSWTVRNVGTGSASGTWNDAVYLSRNPTLDSSAQYITQFPESWTLAPNGGQYSDSHNVTLNAPGSTITGPAYLLVVANADQGLGESDTTDNVGSAAINLSAPDLTVSNVSAPAAAVVGGTITVSWTVTNQGSVAAMAQWYDAVYISPDNVFDSNARYVGSFAAPAPPLAAGASYTQTYSVVLPLTTTGPAYLLVVADSLHQQAETDKTNNVRAQGIDVSAADLTVTTVTAPASGLLGQQVSVSWTVQNVGSGPADQNWSDGIYLSTKTVLDGSATLLARVPVGNNSPLAAGAGYTHTAQVTLPSVDPAGTYYILVRVNDQGSQLEISLNNNVAASAPIAVSGADLAVSSVIAPAGGVAGQSVNLSWTVTNNGTIPASQNWTDGVYLSTRNVFDSSAFLLTRVPAGSGSPLAPGSSYTHSAQVTLPVNDQIPGGVYYILVNVDDLNQQAETNKGNNAGASSALTLTLPPLPDLVVNNVTAPANGFTGQAVLVSWTDRNQGTAPANGPWVDQVYYATDSQGTHLTSLGSFVFPNVLAVGASAQRTQEVMLPSLPGSYYFVVKTDADQGAPEGPFDRNDVTVSATPITVTQAPLPDLVVTTLTPPANGVLSGTSVPITFTVTNQGTGPTSAPVWQDWVILSQDPTLARSYYTSGTLNNDQILLNQAVVLNFNNPSYLDVGQSYQQTVNVTLPISAQGTWYVYVVPDGLGAHYHPVMQELTYADKLALSSGFQVTLAPLPALTVANVQAPAQGFSGQPITLSWTVANQGTGPTAATSWTDAVYMSSQATLDNSATLLGTFVHQGALVNGSSYADTEIVILPVGVSGQFYFLVKTDVNGQVFENTALANTVAATATPKTVNLTPPPDLTVTAVTVPATALASHALTFSYHVANAGAGATPNPTWTDSYYLSPTATFNAGTATVLGQQTVLGALNTGDGYDNTVTVTLPNGLSGMYYLFVDTDSSNTVFELNKTNNFNTPPAALRVASMPADLVVSAARAPTNAQAGAAALVTWTVANQGTGDTAVTGWQDSVYLDTGSTLSSQAVLLGTFPHNGLLIAGGSYNQAQLVILPIGLNGNYSLFVVTNTPGQGQTVGAVYESNTANDVSAALPVAISQQVADLQVTALTAPSSSTSGATVTVSWTVTNNGAGATNATYWYDDLWLSTRSTLASGGTDVFLGTVQHTNALAAGGSYQASITVALPKTVAASSYYFIVATDRPVAPPNDTNNQGVNLVFETNEANNQTATSTPAAIAAAAVPDLAVASVTVPATAAVGQTLAVSWTVTNSGSATGNVPIADSVYLSVEQVFDPNADRYLGTVVFASGLGAGASYTQTQSLPLPAGLAGTYYVFVVTNSNYSIYEVNTANDVAYNPQPVQIQLGQPADLVAGAVAVPANAVPGQNVTITYQVTNNSPYPANGTWTDALYLSSTPTWSVNAPLLGQVLQTQNLAANGGSYTGTLTAPLPGVAPGSYYVILRANILNNFREATQGNNLSASPTRTAIDAPALTLGTPVSGTLAQGQSVYYKVVVSAGQTLQINLQGQSANASNELYVSFGTMPSRTKSDFRFTNPLAANQQVLVPTTQQGTYFILAYAPTVPGGSEAYILAANTIPFSLISIDQTAVGNTGTVTIGIHGSKLDTATSFVLSGPGNTTLKSVALLVTDSTTVHATFNTTGVALGSYSLTATQNNGPSATLTNVLRVIPGAPAQVDVQVSLPAAVLPGAIFDAEVVFRNTGSVDTFAPILELDSSGTAMLGLSPKSLTGTKLSLLGRSPDGPAEFLRPGESVTLTVYAKALSLYSVKLQASAVTASNAPIDFNSLVASAGLPPGNFAGKSDLLTILQAVAGSTHAQYLATLQETVSLLDGRQNTGVAAVPLSEAWNQELAMVSELWSLNILPQLQAAGSGGGSGRGEGTPPGQTYSLPPGQDVAISTFQQGDPGGPVYYITAGFTASESYGPGDWPQQMAQAIINWMNMPNSNSNGMQPTINLVNWASGTGSGLAIDAVRGSGLGFILTDGNPVFGLLGGYYGAIDYYNQASGITPAVGQVIAHDIINGGYNPNDVTLIGHSLGAQASFTAGFDYTQQTGQLLKTIEALDPAGPGFPVPYAYADAGAAQTVNTVNTSYVLGEYENLVGTPGHNYFPSVPDGIGPVAEHTYATIWYLGALNQARCTDDPKDPNNTPDHPKPVPLPDQILGDLIRGTAAPVTRPHDPNDIIGPAGFGDQRFVSPSVPMAYRILFQNEATASAPAQVVTITQQLDPNLDWRTFRLGGFGFGGLTFQVPANVAYYQTTLDLIQQDGFDVSVVATIDERSGIATWTFTTIDPTTGQTPINPTVGFLPPDNANGVGEGFVSYTVLANQANPTGTVINAQATVVFNTEPPLNTASIFNTVDNGAGLTSAVIALPPTQSSTNFTVSWSGTANSAGSGLSSFTVYVADNGGPFLPWLQNTTLTAAVYSGQLGHTYAFYSVATDNAGNTQPTSATAQATTSIPATTITAVATDHPAGSIYGQALTFTATVSLGGGAVGTPTGSVQFVIDGVNFGAPVALSNGMAQVSAVGLPAGTHSVTVVYISDSPNFLSSATAGPLNTAITPAVLTITADNKSRVYGGANPAFTVVYTGFVLGQDPSALAGVLSFSTTATAGSYVGSYPITPGGLTSGNYAITFVAGTLTITPAALTVTANDATKVYGQANPAFTASYGGFVNGDTAASLGGSLSFTTAATAASAVGAYAVTPGGLTSANYTITFVNGTLTITPAALTISADNQSKLYGAPLPTLTVTYSGFVNGDTAASLSTPPAVSTTATAASHVGSYAITAAGATAANYTITYVAGTLTVTPTVLSVTADNQTKVYGAPLPTLTVTYAGFVNGDTPASLTTVPTVTTTATPASHVAGNPYGITASGAADPDYTFIYTPGTLTVTAAPLTVTAYNQTKVYGAALPALTVSYSGFVNGDTATSLTTAPAVTTTATAASHVAGNPYSISANGAVDPDYTISYVSGTLTVTPVALTISADNQTMVYGGSLPPLTASYAGFVNGDTPASLTTAPTLSTTATAASHVGLYAITAAGAADSDYTISYVAGNLTITPAALTITADNQTMTYGGTLPAFTASYSGFVNGDTAAGLTAAPALATTATAASHVGTYAITATAARDPDYTISYVYGTLTITPVALTITANNPAMVYGGSLPTLTASYAGFVNGDTAASLTTAPTLSTTATASSHVGTYAVTAAGALDPDYTISYVAGTLTITPAPLTISADNQTKVYGQANPALTASYSGFVNGDTAASLSTPPALSTTATAASPVGTYAITAAGAADADYTITYVAGTLTVTPAATTAAVSSSLNPSTVGQSVTFTATVTAVAPGAGTPTGTVTFMDGTTSLGSATLSGGTAMLATTTLGAGTHTITVVYAGDGNFTGSTSPALSQAVNNTTGVPVVTAVSPNNGTTAGGTVVTITGSGFTGATAVRFGATVVTAFTVVSDGQITATTPAHAGGLVDIQVVTPNGTSVITAADQFTFVEPMVSGVSPSAGSTAGGTVVTITGTNFTGVTGVKFGATAAASFTVVSATQITATAPAHAAGVVDIQVLNAGEGSDLTTADHFTYLAPAVTAVSPNTGSTAGGTVITITGSNFVGVTVVHIDGVTATSFTVVSPTQITATTPAHAAGVFNVRVTNAGATSATVAADQFTYLPPAVTAVSPNTGTTLGDTVVTITGSSFVGITAVRFGTTPATSFTVVSPTQITATAPAHGPGAVFITVSNAGATSASVTAARYTYQGPVVSAVSPASGSTAGGTVVTITGSNFLQVTAVTFGGTPATSYTVVSPTQITATAPAHGPAVVNVRVTGAGLNSAIVTADQFTYLAPAVTGISPNAGSTAGGTVVTITGSNFTSVTDVRFGGISAAHFTVVSATQITATAPVHAGGNMDVRVLNAGAASAVVTADQFTYQEPVVLGISPVSGLTAGGTVVTVFGSGFVGVTQVRFGDTPAASFTVVSPNQLTATAPAHTAGAVDVRVVNAGDTSDALSGDQFTYFAPAVAGVSPNVGSTAGGTAVTITGSHFTGVTQVKFGGTAAAHFTVVSDTQITATTPVRAAGQVDVQVVNGGVTSAATAADKFTYQAPVVLGISPGTGPVTGGTVVTITGSGFVGVTAVRFGTTAAASFTVVSPTQITAVAPAHAAGTVDVRVVNAGATSALSTADQFTYFQGTGPGAAGGRFAPAAVAPAGGQGEAAPEAQNLSAGAAITGLVSSLDVQAAALTRADVESFFSAAPGPVGPEPEAWVTELALAHKAANDALSAPGVEWWA